MFFFFFSVLLSLVAAAKCEEGTRRKGVWFIRLCSHHMRQSASVDHVAKETKQ